MTNWTTTLLNLRYHWKALLIGGLGLIGASFVLVVLSTAAWAEDPYPHPWNAEKYLWEDECEEEGGCPTLYVIEGFDVWISPTVYQAPDYTQAAFGREMDILKAQLLWITSSDVFPPTAIQQLIDSGVSLYLDTPSEWSTWWPCGDWKPGAGCYAPWLNRVAVPVLGAGWGGRSWLQQDHTRQSMVLHELAHAFHYKVVKGGIENVCFTRHFERVKGDYEAVEKREQGNWLGPLDERPPLHERVPPGPYPLVKHYATTNVMEYFAEASEAMFALNDFYPWSRNDLWHHDPDGYRLIWEAWHDPIGFCPQQRTD